MFYLNGFEFCLYFNGVVNVTAIPGRVESRQRKLRRGMTSWRIQRGRHMAVDEEVSAVDLFQGRSPVGFERQQTADEVASRHGDMRWNCELVVDDPHVRLFECGRLERRSTAQQRVPDVYTPYIVSQSTNQSWIFRVVQVVKSLQDPLEVGNNLTAINVMSANEAWKRSVLDTQQVIAPGAARRYARRRRQFDSRRIYVRPRTGPHMDKLQAASVSVA